MAIGLIFNLVTSSMFAQGGNPFNLTPVSIGEWICDIVSILILVFGNMMMCYDIWSYKPKKRRIYKRVNGEVVEIIEEN